jgi:two-component system OmpR family sensor kinase/two-component system sensor histidine kinase BaeS
LRLRFFLAFALVAAVAILSILLLVRQGAVTEVRSFVSRGGMMGIDRLVQDLESSYARRGSWAGAQELLAGWRMGRGMGMGQGMMGGLWLRLADREGNVLADNLREPAGRISEAERQAAVVLHDHTGAPVGYLAAAGGTSEISERLLLERLNRAGWIAAGIAGGLALLLAVLLSYRLLRPVEELTRAAAAMAAGDLSQRVQPQGSDALSTLARSFNHMAGSMQHAEKNRRAMTADIAHELRTPIAIQRAHLEALQDGVYPLTPENLQPVLDQTELLTRLVEDLRTLALADAGELRLEAAPVDLPALVRRVLERFRPEAESRSITLQLYTTNAETLRRLPADGGRIEQVLNNLFSNALRHTPDGGEVSASLAAAGDWAEVRIRDSGAGIAAEDLPRLFERFFRADASRSRAAGGTGLGLAIARQIALAHGGDLLAGNHPEGGAEFTLRLPKTAFGPAG